MNKKKNTDNFKLSVRLFDEKFNVIFELNKEDYRECLKEIDKVLKLKFDEDISVILKRGKK